MRKPALGQSIDALRNVSARVFIATQARFVAATSDLSGSKDVLLTLYGTGIRGRSDLAKVAQRLLQFDGKPNVFFA